MQRKMVKKEDHMISIVPRTSGDDCHPETVSVAVADVSLTMSEVVASRHDEWSSGRKNEARRSRVGMTSVNI